MSEEVRIVGKLDDSDIQSGVARISAAVQKIKDAIGSSIAPAPGAAAAAGGDAATSFSNAFIKRLIIRDAIYGAIRGIQAVIGDMINDARTLLDLPVSKDSWIVQIQKMIASFWDFSNEVVNSKFAGAVEATADRNIAQIKADEEQRFHNQLYKDDPRTFGKASVSVEDEINRSEQGLVEAKIQNQRFHESKAILADLVRRGEYDPNTLNATLQARTGGTKVMSDDELKAFEERQKGQMKQLDFELQIAKEKERMEAEAKRKTDSAESRAEKAEKAAEKKTEREADHERKHEQSVEKRKKENELAAERADLSLRGPERDLHFTEKLLDHQKATSAVRINGGLFGKSDSAGQLVTHALQQINELKRINQQLAEIKKERHELTVL